MARLCDPSSGDILVNGQNIKTYSVAELHKHMSLLFQSSADLPLSLKEFIGIGDLNEINNIDKIRQAAADSGAIEFIDKLEKGFDSAFESGGPINETSETLYRDIQEWDGDSDDEDDDKKEGEEGDDSDDTSDEEADESSPKKGKSTDEKSAKVEADEPTSDNKEDSTQQDKDDKDTAKTDKDEEIDTTGGRLVFSGGQRQKLNLARNFMRNTADLAIFDE